MSPDEINTVTDGLIKVHAMAEVYGPGLLLAAAIFAAVWACRRIAGAVHDRLAARRCIRRLEAFANHPAHRSPRKEKP